MRVLHIDTGRKMRGGQWQALYLLGGLQQAGHEATLLAREESPLFAKARERDIDVRPLSLRPFVQPSDLVHAHDARAHTLAALLARRPLVVSRRVAFPIKATPGSRWKYGRATRFLAISSCVREELLTAGVDDSRIDIVYDGVPLLPLCENPKAILTPEFHDPRKASALVREAASLAGVEVRFSRDLAADLQNASILLYLTDMEGLGSAALLAMSAGVPVVASAVGGLREAVQHEVTGLLVENRAGVVAAAIRRCVDDPAWARQMGLSGRQRVEQSFTIEHMVERTLASYRKALAC